MPAGGASSSKDARLAGTTNQMPLANPLAAIDLESSVGAAESGPGARARAPTHDMILPTPSKSGQTFQLEIGSVEALVSLQSALPRRHRP